MARKAIADRATLQFLGGVGNVTGSKYLIRVGPSRILLDCGLFQGPKKLRQRNWDDPPFNPGTIDAVVLSHAHIDHSGYLPLLARRGFRGPVFCTPGTRSLLKILLPDSAHIQEEQAAHANRHRYSKHDPALPLYARRDADRALRLAKPRGYGQPFPIGDDLLVTFRRAGHILGSATVEVKIDGPNPLPLVFSGDLGPSGRPMLRDPEPVPRADVLLVESTYGNRDHSDADVRDELQRVILETVQRGGVLLVPAFAVGRTQELVWYIRELEDAGRIPQLPVFVDSPMATDVTQVFCRHPEDHSIDMKLLMDQERCPLCCKTYAFVRTAQESKALNDKQGPFIIIAASGMATHGRIVHHLANRVSDPSTTVLLVGFQAAGTRGRSLQDGATHVRMFGHDLPVRARVESVEGLSAHAGQSEILRWLDGFGVPPKHTFIVHGEPSASETLRERITERFDWPVSIPAEGDCWNLFEISKQI